MSVKFNKDHCSIAVENVFDNTISIEVSGFEYSSIDLDMDNDEERRALEDLAGYINLMLYERRPKNLDKKMLTHHHDCIFWVNNNTKCDCYLGWVQKDLRELDRLREAARSKNGN